MNTITITVTVDESRHLIVPDDVPPGRFKLTFELITNGEPSELENGQPVTADTLTPEESRRRLKEAGLLVEFDVPPDAVELSPTEREHLWQIIAGGKNSLDYVNEDREERF